MSSLNVIEFEPSQKHYSPYILHLLSLCCIERIICTGLSSVISQIFVHNFVTFIWYLAFHFDFLYCTRTAMQWMHYTAHKCTIHFLYHNNLKKLLSENIPVLNAKVFFLGFRTRILDLEGNLPGTICSSTFVHYLCSCSTEVFAVWQKFFLFYRDIKKISENTELCFLSIPFYEKAAVIFNY